MPGYFGTPLAKKLSLKDGMRVWFDAMPESVRDEIATAGIVLSEEMVPTPGIHAVHVFVTSQTDLEERLGLLRDLIDPAGMIWVSWPKKASKLTSDVTENVIRDVALLLGLVDVKVCAIDATWSGLKLVVRRQNRDAHPQAGRPG